MRKLLQIARFGVKLGLVGLLLGTIAAVVTFLIINPQLPSVDVLRDVQLQVPLRVYTADGKLMSVFGEQRRMPVKIDAVPDRMKQAFIAGEDANFYSHSGVSIAGLTRAVWHVIRTGGDKGPGGSTITMQLTRNFFLDFSVTYERKLKEMILALKIERELSKDEILELYLNKIYLGHRAYGVAAAARVYYGKTLAELTLAENAMIASLPKAPSRINPVNNLPRALERRNYVLRRMYELGNISKEEMDAGIAEEDRGYLHGPTVEVEAPYAAEMVRQAAIEMLGNNAYTGGYEIYTTFDSRLQSAANQAVRRGLMEYDKRHGYRGPEGHVDLNDQSTPADWDDALAGIGALAGLLPALVLEVADDMAVIYLPDGQTGTLLLEEVVWARPFVNVNRRGDTPESVADVLNVGDIIRVARTDTGDWSLSQVPEVEGALVSLDPEDGAMRALVGGFDFDRSKFNRIVQGRRQPGSSFKPFIYSAALDDTFTPATLVNDAPVVFDDPDLEREWFPENFEEEFFGPTRLRMAMIKSINLVSIRILREIGIPYGREYITRFGFGDTELPGDLSLALGSASVTPLSMARGYAVFANGGFLVEPHFIERIDDATGATVFEARPLVACEQCEDRRRLLAQVGEPDPADFGLEAGQDGADSELTEEDADPMLLAERVIDPRNNFLLNTLLRDVVKRGTGRGALKLGRTDLAGKTGTTNEQRDAWFSGFNRSLVTTTWVGFDKLDPLGRGEVGGRAALPIWIEFMGEALRGIPDHVLKQPPGVAQALIDPKTGKLAPPTLRGAITEYFYDNNLPEPMEALLSDPDAPTEDEDADPYDIF